jgi:hypothetical protein
MNTPQVDNIKIIQIVYSISLYGIWLFYKASLCIDYSNKIKKNLYSSKLAYYSTIVDSLVSQSINITYDKVKDLRLVSLAYTLEHF